MSKMLIYIGENQQFDVDLSIKAIKTIPGVAKSRRGDFIGAIFECEYSSTGHGTIVRISPELETITVEGLEDESLEFALELQKRLPVDLHAIDMDYSFNVALRKFGSVAEFRRAISR